MKTGSLASFAFLISLCGCMEANTQYSCPDLPQKFEQVQVGDSIETLYAKVGPPLSIDVNKNRAAYHKPGSFGYCETNIAAVKSALADTNKELYLYYSRSKSESEFNYLYWVAAVDGKVTVKQTRIPMD